MINTPVREPQIRQILNLRDAVLRNLWITQAYHDLGMGLAKAMDGEDAEPNTSWLGFAVWASKTAGISIRGEDLPKRLREMIHDSSRVEELIDRIAKRHPNRILMRVLRRVDAKILLGCVDGILDGVADEIAAGNTIVFQELAPIFARMIDLIERSPDAKHPDPQDFADLMKTVARDASSPESQRDLEVAFANYFNAVLEPGRKTRAELVLLANAQAVLHEQERLNGPINKAMNVPIRAAVRNVFHPWLLRLLPNWMLRLFDGPLEEIVEWLTDVWQSAATEHMMTLNTATEKLRLGDNVPDVPGEPLFPVELARLDHPDLQRFASTWDRTGGTGRPTGAEDWGEIDERMNYIFTLFRSRQQDRSLLAPPFTAEQLAEMQHERVPGGPL